MSPRDWKVRIDDILGAIASIQQYTRGMTFEAFADDPKTIDAVVHNLMVIGEAARHVPDHVTNAHREVPWDKMHAMRNVIVHVYFGIRKQIVWETIQKDLPGLAPVLSRLLEIEDGREGPPGDR